MQKRNDDDEKAEPHFFLIESRQWGILPSDVSKKKQGNSCVAVKIDAWNIVRALRKLVVFSFWSPRRMRGLSDGRPRLFDQVLRSIGGRPMSGMRYSVDVLTRSILAIIFLPVCPLHQTIGERASERPESLEALIVLLIKVMTS
jgi:hypothetical protein